jgi:hypothetical protein
MVPREILAHIKQELTGLVGVDYTRRVGELAVRYSKSEQTIGRWANLAGIRRRKEKATKGTTKMDREALLLGASFILASRRLSNQTTLPANDAKEILEDSGLLKTSVSDSLFRAQLRQQKMSARDMCAPSPHKDMKSEHPNHVWQFDVTNCLQYFLDEKGLGERDMELELEKNKIVKAAKTIRRQLLRYAVVDHCSGEFYFQYFYASGERPEDGEKFLLRAMRPKDELVEVTFADSTGKMGKYNLQGVPFNVYADKGSIARARKLQNLFEALQIVLATHLPGNPRAKGAVEGLMHYLNRFEARLILKRPSSLEELNAWALDWCIRINATKPFRNIAPRAALWSRITNDQLRLCPDEETFWRLVSTGPIEKLVNGSLMIRHNGLKYRVDDVELANTKVTIRENAYESPAIDVHGNGRVWLVRPLEMDTYGRPEDATTFGTYKAHPDTQAQKAKKELETTGAKIGLTFKGTGDKRRAVAPPVGYESPLSVFGNQAEKVPENMAFITRPGTPLEIKEPERIPNQARATSAFEVPRTSVVRQISVSDFLLRLSREAGPISKDLNRQLKQSYPDGISVDEADSLIEEIQSGKWTGRAGEELSATTEGR